MLILSQLIDQGITVLRAFTLTKTKVGSILGPEEIRHGRFFRVRIFEA